MCSAIRGPAKWVHLTFNTWVGSLQWVAHTSLHIPLSDMLPVASGPGPPLSTDHRWSTLRISRLQEVSKRQGNFAFPDFHAYNQGNPCCFTFEALFPMTEFTKSRHLKKSPGLDTLHLPPRWGAFMFPLCRQPPLSSLIVVNSGTQRRMKN